MDWEFRGEISKTYVTSFDPPERKMCGLCGQVSNTVIYTFGKKDVQQGIGAVLIFVGITLCITGVIFTAVAYGSDKKNMVASFPYAGPVLICISIVSCVFGYILCHLNSISTVWQFFKRRKDYIHTDDETENDYLDQEFDDLFSALCFWCILKCVMFRNRHCCTHSEVSINSTSSQNLAGKTLDNTEKVTQPDVLQYDNPRKQSFVSLSSLLNTKIHPDSFEAETKTHYIQNVFN